MIKSFRLPPQTFCPLSRNHAGLLAEMLMDSYRPLYEGNAGWENMPDLFRQFDADVFLNLGMYGSCIFLTCVDGQFAGFSAFTPRKAHQPAIIGYNCIVPRFQGQGLGKTQMLETLKRLKAFNCRKTTVSLSENPFFIPARQMYLSCGFVEKRRLVAGSNVRVIYDRDIADSPKVSAPLAPGAIAAAKDQSVLHPYAVTDSLRSPDLTAPYPAGNTMVA